MRTETGFTFMPPAEGLVRVAISRSAFKGEPMDNFRFRESMNKWLRENCWRAEYEYPDEVSIYPHAVWIDEGLDLIFKLMWPV